MVEFTNEALGRVVRSLREQAGKTQEDLGRAAGYKAGAGVSISRVESGLLRPGAERFEGIARALGLEPDELAARAAEVGEDREPNARTYSAKELRDRARRLQEETEARTTTIKALGDEFNRQHDRAKDEFFMRFVDIASRIEGAEPPDPTLLEDDDPDDANADAVAAYRLRATATGVGTLLAGGAGGAVAGAAVGGAAAYGTFLAAATFGTASTGAAISGLTGVAASNAALALLGGGTLAAGGAGVAGGTMLLAGIVAAPTAILLAGGLLWMRKRNRRQQQELAAQLDNAEAQLAATELGYQALVDILPRAAETLDYIATHAGHALTRWKERLGDGTTTWESLTAADQQRYRDFIDIAAAQLSIVTLNAQGVLTTDGADRDDLITLADQVLTQARDAVTSRV